MPFETKQREHKPLLAAGSFNVDTDDCDPEKVLRYEDASDIVSNKLKIHALA